MRCPSCGSLAVHRSQRTWYESLACWLLRLSRRPYRCDDCHMRFWAAWYPRTIWFRR
jgi:predicted RNA-binding Zn-ribbon protein involved in translation (DUF1610 family)